MWWQTPRSTNAKVYCYNGVSLGFRDMAYGKSQHLASGGEQL